MKYHKNTKIKQFYDNIFENGIIPIINHPTRISEHSASLIDNILTTGTLLLILLLLISLSWQIYKLVRIKIYNMKYPNKEANQRQLSSITEV